MKRVVRTREQLIAAFREQQAYLNEHGALNCWFEKFKPPRTRKQNRKVHAMFDDLADFIGDKNIKGWIKTMDFWPTEIKTYFGEEREVPKSEADLEREEESIVIEHLYMLGNELPGFTWNEKVRAA